MSRKRRFADAADNASMPAATVIPVLQYPDVPAASSWLQAAFGFTERLRIGAHRIQMNVGSAAIVVARGAAPDAGGGVSIMVRVANVDDCARRAAAAGARLLSEPQSYPYGERQFSATDLAGYVWTFSQSVADVDPASWGGELVVATPAGDASGASPPPEAG